MGKKSKTEICSVVVSSCDAFDDLWAPFFTLFFRYWEECPFPIYLIANEKEYPDGRVRTITTKKDSGWATNMRTALLSITTPFILYMQDDYLLTRCVDTEKIVYLLVHAQDRDAACLRLYPSPGPDHGVDVDAHVGIISRQADYRVSLQAALWRRTVLEALLVDGETGWEMEMNGTQRASEREDLFLSIEREMDEEGRLCSPVPYFCTAVEKGYWVPEAVALCEKEGIMPDLKRRPLKGRQKKEPLRTRLLKKIVRR